MNDGFITNNTQKGIITRTLDNLITVWPLNVHQEKELVFPDKTSISPQCMKVGDWIQMEVEHDDVVYHEKIEPVLQTLVTLRGNVQIKTRLYFPNGINRNHEHIIGYSDDVGRVGIFFECSELKANYLYDVWISRLRKKFVSLGKRYNVHWCLIKQQPMIPIIQDGKTTKLLWRNWSVADDSKHFNNTLIENNINSHEVDFSYALSFNDNALRRLYSDPKIREAVYQCSSDFASSIETYLRRFRD